SKEQIRENLQRQRDQMSRFLDFDARDSHAQVLNNADWLVKESLVEFLRDVGKHFTVNIMLQKASVQARLETGISYSESSYTLLPRADIEEQLKAHKKDPSRREAQRTLAITVTTMVHGNEAVAGVVKASAALFGDVATGTKLDAVEEHAPITKVGVKPDTVVD